MVKIIEPKIITDELKPDGSYGRFIAEPLDRGYSDFCNWATSSAERGSGSAEGDGAED